MAKNKIEIDVEVDDKGRTKKLGLESKKAAKGLDDVGKGARTADRNLKGAAQASSNSTKNFSKMAQGTGGLVAAYATLAANIFAISAAYGFLKRAGDVAALTRGQEAYAMKTGKSMKLLTDRIQEATGGILAFNDASQAAAIGQAAGLSNDQLTGLARVAKNASVALGRDLTDSFNRLTRGAIKAEPELLDELGIIIRLDKVTKDYSRTLGKNAKDLTQFEKSQAVVNAVLAQGVEKFDEVGANVNQVARLGKGFTDLVKQIGEFIDPISSFVSGALANNIHGLAAAFSVLGLSIGRALMPAMPAMAGVDELAKSATQDLAGIAGKGATADKMRDGTFDEDVLRRLKKAHQSKTSTVINLDHMEKNERIKNIRIVEAAHLSALAKEKTGVQAWYLNWKANLAALQAEHGKTMGFIKASTATMVSGVNKLLSAVAFIGMLYTAITLVKELLNTLKDDRIKEIEKSAQALEERFRNQNEEVRTLIRGFKEAASPMETLVKQANILSNFSFGGVEGMAQGLGETFLKEMHVQERGADNIVRYVKKQVSQIPEQNEKVAASMMEVYETIKLQSTAFADFGIKATKGSKAVEKGIVELKKPLDIISGTIPSTAEEYDAAVKLLQTRFSQVNAEAAKLNPVLAAQAGAIKGIGQSAEGFRKFKEELKQTSSQFSKFLSFNRQFTDQLSTLTFDSSASDFFDGTEKGRADLAAIAEALNMTVEAAGKLTRLELITKFQTQSVDIRQKEFDITSKQKRLEISMAAISRGKSPLQVAELTRQSNVLKLRNEMLKIEQAMDILKKNDVSTDDTKMIAEQDKLDLLKEQLITAERLTLESARQLDAAKAAAEGTAKTEFAALIKGEKSSIKDAFKVIAKSAVEAVADQLAEQAAKMFTDFIFGSPEKTLEVAMNSNTAALNANTAALGGNTTATGVSSSTSIGSSIGSFFKPKSSLGAVTAPTIGGSISTSVGSAVGDGSITSPITGGGITVDEIVTTGTGAAGTGTLKALFSGFTANLKDIFSGDTPFLEGIGNIFKDAGTDLKGIFGGLGSILGDLGSGFMSLFGFGGVGAARDGGVFSPGGSKISGYAAGGVASGSTGGYPAILHGTEAVVPLPNNKKIPVEMKGGGEQNNNIVVNVASDGTTSTQGNNGGADNEKLGRAVANAVREELQNQKRSGGMLNPYGAS